MLRGLQICDVEVYIRRSTTTMLFLEIYNGLCIGLDIQRNEYDNDWRLQTIYEPVFVPCVLAANTRMQNGVPVHTTEYSYGVWISAHVQGHAGHH